MHITDYPQLLRVLEGDQKMVYLCGAGVSMALGEHRTSWGTWLQNGKSYLNDSEKSEFDRIIGSWTADSMIDAAGFLLDALKQQGTYHDFMRASFSGLTVKQETMANGFSQIHRAGDFIATTNYDLLLEQAASARTVTYSAPGKILQMLRGEIPRQVLHLHGAYDPARGIDDIIADNQQYRDIVLDYILGRESLFAQIIRNLMQVFEASPCRLRIVLLERHYDSAGENWLKRMMDSMDAATTREYLDHMDQKCQEIQSGFHQSLEPNHRRPLFLSFYTELWVYHNGDVPVTGAEALLG